MKTISLLHPFSAKAIGLSEEDVLLSHSKPHLLALKEIMKNERMKISIDYFTGSLLTKRHNVDGIEKRFWPISYPIFKKRHQWREQYSYSHFHFIAKQTPDLTIINMSGHGSKYVFKLARLLRKKNKPYIAMVGGMNMSYSGNALEYYQNAHHIIVHTYYQKEVIIQKEGFADLDITVLPLGIDTSVFCPKEEKISSSENRLLFVGRISRLKQIEIAIKAVCYLQANHSHKTKLSIIGPVSDTAYYDELKELVSELNASEYVVFLGSVQHDALIEHYQNSDVLLLPSQHESFGMVITEAMSCGVPVVALKGAGGPDEIITDGIDGILSTPEEYTEAVLQFFQNQEAVKQMKINARETVIAKYSIEETTRVLFESIQSALHS